MVNPLYLFAASLAVAFLLPLADRLGRRVSLSLVLLTVAAWGAVAATWLVALLNGDAAAVDFGTAGFFGPLAIVLRVGTGEALGIMAISLVGLLSALGMRRALSEAPVGGSMALLMTLMGLSGLVLTRDLFNLFVFLEISSIATYGLIGFDDRRPALRAGFKYMIAGGIASSLYLIGVIYVYRFADHLNLDLAAGAPGIAGTAGTIAVFFLLASLLVELKPFPANGWAIDVYETAHPGVSAILSGASATALLLSLWKLDPVLGPAHHALLVGSGLATFLASNLVAARQRSARRMLGYSSVAQVGLVAAAYGMARLLGIGDERFIAAVAGALLLNHLLSKTGLFLVSALMEKHGDKPGALRPVAAVATGILAAALVGLPPFPGFWAKWSLIRALAGDGYWWLIAVILGGSLVEGFYVLRWFGSLAKGSAAETDAAAPARQKLGVGLAGPVLLAAILSALGIWMGWELNLLHDPLVWAPVAAALVLFILDWMPGALKSILSVALAAAFGWYAWRTGRIDGLRLPFAIMLLGGGALFSISAAYRRGARTGLHPLLSATTLAMGSVLIARTTLEFFLAWELMTVASWLLVLRGRRGGKAALTYITFGMGGAFLIMVGLLSGPETWNGLAGYAKVWPLYLMAAGILVKLGALGAHVWLPGAYAESDDEVSGFLSASLSKAGVFALIAAIITYGGASLAPELAWRILGWIGLATATFGALYAIYQEDIKKTLAWSSMGQIGYIVLAIAMNTQAGWTTGVYLALNHFLYKSMLFLAIAGVIMRVGTRNMYEMGGLIKKMPFTFLSVLMAIIALSGVPPLSGFGGKWLLYSALIAKGWYFEAAVAFFASAVAFLYLFRLIHTIFLGQPKPSQAAVREAPPALTVPQGALMAILMAVSAFPKLMLDPIMAAVNGFFPGAELAFAGDAMVSPLGYWNGTLSMAVTIAVFALCLAWMLLNLHNPQNVKQFNIVYAAERPYKPETTHYAWNFYAPYEKALGFLTRKRGERFWAAVGTGISAVGGAARRIYTGNGQTYALHVVLYVVALYLLMGVL